VREGRPRGGRGGGGEGGGWWLMGKEVGGVGQWGRAAAGGGVGVVWAKGRGVWWGRVET